LTASRLTKSRSGSSTADQPNLGSGEAAGAGRFAPSPTGPLHLGSLLAATASYLDARANGLAWRVRIDDLDRARNQVGAERDILAALERHGLQWDGVIERQSGRVPRYQAALDRLEAQGLLFYCSCSRKDLAGQPIYPGTCRSQRRPRPGTAIRIRVDDAEIEFDDLVRGPQRDNLARSTGDFVIRRRDGQIAYQLATAVDDGDAAISRVVRGRDLLENTARQIFLMQRLGLQVPQYGHIPLIVNAGGQKLSKQNGAQALDIERPQDNLIRILRALGLQAAGSQRAADPGAAAHGQAMCEALLAEAWPGWTVRRVPKNDLPAEP
jgi:glutamyl-Q tRNA(Asp) synthetase